MRFAFNTAWRFLKSNKVQTILIAIGIGIGIGVSVQNIKDKIYEGNQPENNNEVLIGKDLSKNLDIKTGDNVFIITPAGNNTKVLVTGIYDLTERTEFSHPI